jgi:small subunit ribosomal protein S15
MISLVETAEIMKKFGKNEKDSGSAAVQVAILTTRIKNLSPHFEKNHLDYHSKRGLLRMIGRRKSFLKYMSRKNPEEYAKVIKELGLRK